MTQNVNSAKVKKHQSSPRSFLGRGGPFLYFSSMSKQIHCVCGCMCTGVHMLSHSVMSNSATPWTVAHQAPLSKGFPRQEYWSELPSPSPEYLPESQSPLGIKPMSPALQADSSPLSHQEKAKYKLSRQDLFRCV